MSNDDGLPPFRFRDIGFVVREVLAEHRLPNGDALLVLVREPSKAQAVEHVSRIRRGRWRALDRYNRSMLIERTVDAMPVPDWSRGGDGGPGHSVLTIVGRKGFTVLGRGECDWLLAWRYANCFAHAYTGDLVLVTDHGWCDFMTRTGDATPRLAA